RPCKGAFRGQIQCSPVIPEGLADTALLLGNMADHHAGLDVSGRNSQRVAELDSSFLQLALIEVLLAPLHVGGATRFRTAARTKRDYSETGYGNRQQQAFEAGHGESHRS